MISLPNSFKKLLNLFKANNMKGCLEVIGGMSVEEVNTPVDGEGTSLLMKGIESNQLDLVDCLLLNGADVSLVTAGGKSAIKLACDCKDLSMLRLIFKYCSTEKVPFAIFDLLSSSATDEIILEILCGVERSFFDVIKDHFTVLHMCIERRRVSVLKAFVSMNLSHLFLINDASGWNALQFAEMQANNSALGVKSG